MSTASSRYEATVEMLAAEADAILAFSAAIHQLEELSLNGSANLMRIFEKNTILTPQQIEWGLVSDLISSVRRVYLSASTSQSSERHTEALGILSALRDTTDKAWCAVFRATQVCGQEGN